MSLNKSNINRRLDLSSKFIEMGQALMMEGKENKDYAVSQTGTFLILIGGILFDENDVQLFGQLCSMFSAKKVLDNMEATNDDMLEFLKQKSENESYDEYIKRIRNLKDNNGDLPLS